ncbi:unnamed protein product [Penicillium egyptiacum]|uniref:FAD-binding domain-containing protein n=1 Tax=Penicillium egyptiacum TaxID=1303716 RepID=A0A9W4KQ01_9EURO|nr:unnamed protein product [Penicillium egyptiacum]
MAATWMAQAGIKTLVVEKKLSHTKVGHADGLESRTLEILDSFGIGAAIWAEANRTIKVCLWDQFDGQIRRTDVATNHNQRLSRYQEATLGHGRVEQHFLGLLQSHRNIELKWDTTPISLKVDSVKPDDMSAYPVQPANRYKADVRKRCIIKSLGENIMIIPRERMIVRFYIQLSAAVATKLEENRNPSLLVGLLREIFHPYTFASTHIEWLTIYRVGRGICRTFSLHDRSFLAGDSLHTHSPKAGQGMNVGNRIRTILGGS